MIRVEFERYRERFQGRPHGTRHRYLNGCKCMLCRAANSRYETGRAAARKAGDWNGYVDAAEARAHLQALSRKGIGRRSVHAACGVSETILHTILTGQRARIRARTHRCILAVDHDARADHSYVPAGPAWRLLDDLLRRGFSKAQLARWILGPHARSLQLKRAGMITARSAARVERMYNLVNQGKLRRDR